VKVPTEIFHPIFIAVIFVKSHLSSKSLFVSVENNCTCSVEKADSITVAEKVSE
jgi:hypothetical protein